MPNLAGDGNTLTFDRILQLQRESESWPRPLEVFLEGRDEPGDSPADVPVRGVARFQAGQRHPSVQQNMRVRPLH